MGTLDLNQEIQDMLKKAQLALESGDRKGGIVWLDKILNRHYTHPDTWQLIHRYFGGSMSFEQFRYEFTRKFYPAKLDLVAPLGDSQFFVPDIPAVPEPVSVTTPALKSLSGALETSSGASASGDFQNPKENDERCPYCGNRFRTAETACPGCGFDLSTVKFEGDELSGCPFCGDKGWQKGRPCPACGYEVETQAEEKIPATIDEGSHPPEPQANPWMPAAQSPAQRPRMMNFCPRCGMQRDDEDLFCRRCGQSLELAPSSRPAEVVETATAQAQPPAPVPVVMEDEPTQKIAEISAGRRSVPPAATRGSPTAPETSTGQVCRVCGFLNDGNHPVCPRCGSLNNREASHSGTLPAQYEPPPPSNPVEGSPRVLPPYPDYKPEPEGKRIGMIIFTWMILIGGFGLAYIDPDFLLFGYGIQILTLVMAIVLISHKPSKTNGWVIMGVWLAVQIIGFIIGFLNVVG